MNEQMETKLFFEHTWYRPPFDKIRSDKHGRAIFIALFSVKHGKPVGSNYLKLIQIIHNIADYHKPFLKIVLAAIEVYGREEQLNQEDGKKRWSEKVKKFKLTMNDEKYQHDNRFDKQICLLFPELADKLAEINLENRLPIIFSYKQ